MDESPGIRSAYERIEAETYNEIHGLAFEEGDDEEAGRVTIPGRTRPGDYLGFRDIDFGTDGADQFRARIKHPVRGETIRLEIRLDRPDGCTIGILPAFKQWRPWSTLACPIARPDGSRITGVHCVYVVVASEPVQGLGIRWVQFARRHEPVPAAKPAPLPPPADGEFRIYYGNLHSHTGFSDGAGTPDEAFTYARETAKLDFLAVTEHSNLYDEALDPQLSPKWKSVQASADSHTEAESFVGIAGTETTWYNDIGHMNTFGIDFFINPYDTYYNDLGHYYDLIKRHPGSINQWNHPWDHDFHAFLPYDKEADQVIYLLEVPCVANPGVDSISYYIDALDKGWHVAPAGNQDNHIANWGTMNDNRTAILCERLSREHLFDAIRHYRVYSTSDPHMQVFYRMNGEIMGSTLHNPSTLEVTVAVSGIPEGTASRLELIAERGEVVKSKSFDSGSISWNFRILSASRYYWVKVLQKDRVSAITAPIWTRE